jgi:RNase P subunit RPR2
VLCKACGERTIFVENPVTVTIENGKRFLTLKCPSPSCGQERRYEESELEIR